MSIGYINPARNGGFFLLPLLTWCLRENLSNKKGLQEKTLKPLAIVMVPEVGIEPTWMQDPLDFESSASTNSATRAQESASARGIRAL